MATALPAYATTVDVYFNESPVDCLVLETDTYVLEWDKLHESDKNVIVNVLVPDNGGTLPATDLATIADYVLPNGMTFISTYGFAIKDISASKPPIPINLNSSTTVYYNGTNWRRIVDDAILA